MGRAGADPRLGRPSRQWDERHLPQRPDVLFVSIHESPLYPGTGPASDLGLGAGEGYTVNLPVPPGSGDDTFRSLVDHVVLPLIAAWEPQLVLVSAGFDAHSLDPLASCRVSEPGYAEMAALAAARVRCGSARRWGWCSRAATRSRRWPDSVAALMPVLVADAAPAATDAVAVHPLAEAAARRRPVVARGAEAQRG